MATVHHRYVTVQGQRLFYQEAGRADAPAIVLLHGFPTSSHMFRHVIPLLAGTHHVIAPDHIGFGLSDTPSVDEFEYSFDLLAKLTLDLLDQISVQRFAMYVQDYGAPVGWRLALANPAAVTAIVSQNGNAYDVGFAEEFWRPVRAYWDQPTPEHEAALRQALTLEAIRWQYLHGVPDKALVSPDCWYHDFAMVSRPGNAEVQLRLLADYATNVALYPRVHDYLRDSGVPVLAIWGRNDEIFRPEGALAFAGDSPGAQICLLDGGHFLLESHLDVAADTISHFLDRVGA